MSEARSADGALRHSPLQAVHEELGATLTEFAGWQLPLRFTGEIEEHRGVRERCGLFDISHMGQLFVAGSDAGRALSHALVSDVSSLAPGAARYTMIGNELGGVLDDLIVYRRSDDAFLVIANASNTKIVRSELEERFADYDASVEDRTDERALISLQGPLAVELMSSLLDKGTPVPKRFHFVTTEIAGCPVLLARTGYTGEDGFELSLDRADAEALWRLLLGGDASIEVAPVGLAACYTLRLEAGLPLYGHELSADRSPLEAGFGWVVDLDHDFVGALALRKLKEEPSEERLVGLVASSRRVPRQGYGVIDLDGNHVGEVTSGAPSPTLGAPIAMAYVKRRLATPGTALDIDVRGRRERAEVVSLPFWRRASPPDK